ncbi:TMEM165/GDT1 family protein [Halolamina sp.]|uniref:TMEM165/GDT1 family protein n=1 Tax=Halolamina sp. TaxID=1940283 RepID=UPI003562CF22
MCSRHSGDKGQLVVVTLASRYDPKKVFFGTMGAFTLWSGLEVLLGQYVVSVLPGSTVTLLGLVPESFLLGVLATLVLLGVVGLLRQWRRSGP